MNKLIIKKQWLILLLLFFGVSGLFFPLSLYLILLIYPIILHKTNVKKYIDSSFWWLVIFSITFITTWSYNTGFEPGKLIYYTFYPPLFYLTGGYFVDKFSNFNSIIKIILILIVAYSLIYLRNTIFDTVNYGLINMNRSIRVNDNSILGANYQQIRASLSIAGIGLLFVHTRNPTEKRLKNIFILLSILGLFSTIHFVNRTGLALALFSILMVFFKLIKKKSTFVLIFITGIFLIVLANYLLNLASVHVFIESYQVREVNEDFSSSTFGGRIVRWNWILNSLITHPFGDISSAKYGYAHNLWLDAGRLSGIIPFITLIIFTITSLIKAVKLVIKNHLSLFFSCFLITLNITFFLQSFVEPVLESDPTFFWLFVLLLGMQNTLYKRFITNKLNIFKK